MKSTSTAGNKIDAVTRRWIRNRSDELATENGCRFDPIVGAWPVYWIERYCRLYEGDQAGEPLILHGCHKCREYGLPSLTEWRGGWNDEAKAIALKRAKEHARCVARGHHIDWQYDVTIRFFGWQRYSEKWQAWVRRFVECSFWCAKKGKKSPTLAAWGLYLMAGDGEPGQKVFLAAKDGQQARGIAGKHTFEMLRLCPELKGECTTNQNLMQITHEETRSILVPLSSSNSRTQEAKHGLNGSVLIDETHVVDGEFVSIIRKAGASRKEPVFAEFSTAGSNPDSYGRQRFDYAAAVEAGAEENERMFVAIYAAPQDVGDEQLAADPLKFARMANPALGHTIDPDEFLHDYKTSRKSLTDFARFKYQRLNIWQTSETPWLPMHHWAECRGDYTEQDLIGRDCTGAMDLAKTRDTAALVLTFAEDLPEDDQRAIDRMNRIERARTERESSGKGLPAVPGAANVADRSGTEAVPYIEPGPLRLYRQLPFFWIPRARAEELRGKAKYLEWAAAGHITLVDGDTIDYDMIEETIVELRTKFNLIKFTYDSWYAQQLVQRLIKRRTFSEPTGDPQVDEIVSFIQGMKSFAGPTDEYEGLVIDHLLLHPGNKVLTWQAANAKVRTDENHNKRPVKPKHGDYHTIDGIVAGIMSLALAISDPTPQETGLMLI